VTGAGGFIGGHLVADLLDQGYERVRAVDIKPFEHWYQVLPRAENLQRDLAEKAACYEASESAGYVFNLAADMGGMGFIETHKADCMISVLINTHMLMAARDCGVRRFLYSSSACVYAADKQTSAEVTALKESDAYPAMPEDGYGWEKLFSERMCRHFTEDFGLETRIARYHNSQCLRAERDLRWRPRKGAGGDLPEGHSSQARGPRRDRDLGRWRANAKLHVHR
jgi:nucleoside-diphosphate-sugar epimerase